MRRAAQALAVVLLVLVALGVVAPLIAASIGPIAGLLAVALVGMWLFDRSNHP